MHTHLYVHMHTFNWHSQVPDISLLLGLGLCCCKVWMFSWCPDHLCPAYSLLQLHQSFLILVPLHKHTSHLNACKPLPLRHWDILLEQMNEAVDWALMRLQYGKKSMGQLIEHWWDCSTEEINGAADWALTRQQHGKKMTCCMTPQWTRWWRTETQDQEFNWTMASLT